MSFGGVVAANICHVTWHQHFSTATSLVDVRHVSVASIILITVQPTHRKPCKPITTTTTVSFFSPRRN